MELLAAVLGPGRVEPEHRAFARVAGAASFTTAASSTTAASFTTAASVAGTAKAEIAQREIGAQAAAEAVAQERGIVGGVHGAESVAAEQARIRARRAANTAGPHRRIEVLGAFPDSAERQRRSGEIGGRPAHRRGERRRGLRRDPRTSGAFPFRDLGQ